MMRMKKHPITNRPFDICCIVQNTLIIATLKFRHLDICNISILFIFIYGCVMHIVLVFNFFFLIELQVSMKQLDLVCFSHSNIHLRLSIF